MNTPADKPAAREFWINYYGKHSVFDCYGVGHLSKSRANADKMSDCLEVIHVIEYAAYEELKAENELLRKQLEIPRVPTIENFLRVQAERNAERAKSQELEAEVKSLKADLKMWKGAHDLQVGRKRNLSDKHGDLHKQCAEFRGALEEIKSGGGRAEVLGLDLFRCPQCASADIAREVLAKWSGK